MNKIWQIAQKIPSEFKDKFPEIHPIILQLLWNRGLKTQKEIDEFLLPDYSEDLHDPFLFNEMEKIVERIQEAIDSNEKITIYGDYDADGICGTAILYSTLNHLGAKVDYYLPDREKEGYGLNKEAIEKIINQGTKLIISVDCGITNYKEIDLVNKLGAEIIVTDHHTPLDNLPNALFILNPKIKNERYPFKELAGSGVAFKLAQALLRRQSKISNSEAFEKWLLDLVAIGTIADLVQLKGENRTLVKYGLIVLNKSSRVGLRALIRNSNLSLGNLNFQNISDELVPRLNAAGVIDHANIALEMLLTKEKEEGEKLAKKLEEFNRKRQKLIEKIFNLVRKKIGEETEEKIIVEFGKDWPISILGLTSHYLVEFYHRPVILLTVREKDIRGSGRSIEEFNLIESLKKLERFFSHYGGHTGAAGFTLKEKNLNLLNEFCQEIKKLANEKLEGLDLREKIFIEAEIDLSEINWPLYEEIKKFEPFGCGNPKPLFLTRGLEIEEIKNVGKNHQHLKIIVTSKRKLIYFWIGDKLNHLKRGDKIDVVFELNETEWDGLKELEFKIVDLKKSL